MPRFFFFLAFYFIVTPRFRRSNFFFFSHVLLSKCHRFSWSRLWFAAKNAHTPGVRSRFNSFTKKEYIHIRVYISGWICQPKGYLWNWYFCYHSNKSPSCYGVILSVTVAFVFNYIPYKEGTPCFELGVLLFGDCENKK